MATGEGVNDWRELRIAREQVAVADVAGLVEELRKHHLFCSSGVVHIGRTTLQRTIDALTDQAAALAAKETEANAKNKRLAGLNDQINALIADRERSSERLRGDGQLLAEADKRIAALEAALREIKHHAHNADAAALWFGEINRIVDAALAGKTK